MKPMYHTRKDCGAVYNLEQDDKGRPYLLCSGCGYRLDDWIKWDNDYKDLWKQPEKWQSKKDHLVCLLGFFADQYRRHYGVDFVFSMNDRGLFRGPEIHHLRKIYASYGENAELVKKYIEWIFQTKVQEKKRRITSLGFFGTANFLNEFAHQQQKARQITRSTKIPDNMKAWMEANVPDLCIQIPLKDFGDLHLLLSHIRKGRMEQTESLKKFVEKLKTAKVINEQFEIARWSE